MYWRYSGDPGVDTASANAWSATGSRGASATVTCIVVLAASDPTIRAPAGSAGAAPNWVGPAEADPAATAPAGGGEARAIAAAHTEASAVSLVDGRIRGPQASGWSVDDAPDWPSCCWFMNDGIVLGDDGVARC